MARSLFVVCACQVPSTAEEWQKIADDFLARWNFPMCVGAMDGKHIMLQKPTLSGSTFYNYKHRFSVHLLAVVDANYRIVYVDAGCQGRIGDAGVYQHSAMCVALEHNTVDIPSAQSLPQTEVLVPYVLVADDAFPLKSYIMKPYAHRGLNDMERIFNYRLSRARRVVENAFGILAARFRVFRSAMEVCPSKARDVVLAATVLHNFLRDRRAAEMSTAASESADIAERDSLEVPRGMAQLQPCLQKATMNAKAIRNKFATYFMQEGQVDWQWNVV